MNIFYARKVTQDPDTKDNIFTNFCRSKEELGLHFSKGVFYVIWTSETYRFNHVKEIDNLHYARVFDTKDVFDQILYSKIMKNIGMMSEVSSILQRIYGFKVKETLPSLMVPLELRMQRGLPTIIQSEIDKLIIILSSKLWNAPFSDDETKRYMECIERLEDIADSVEKHIL